MMNGEFIEKIESVTLEELINFYQENKNNIDIHVNNEYPFIQACTVGRNLNKCKWLWELSQQLKSPIDLHIDNEEIFFESCYFNDLNIAKWLWNLSEELKSPIDIHINNDFIFTTILAGKNYEIAEWLYDLSNKINSPYIIPEYYKVKLNYKFKDKCIEGDLTNAMKIYDFSKKLGIYLNINIDNEIIFRWSSSFGKLQIIEWLMKLSKELNSIINFRTNNDEAFKWSCNNNYIDIVEYLCNLCPDYKIVRKNDKFIEYEILNPFSFDKNTELYELYELSDIVNI